MVHVTKKIVSVVVNGMVTEDSLSQMKEWTSIVVGKECVVHLDGVNFESLLVEMEFIQCLCLCQGYVVGVDLQYVNMSAGGWVRFFASVASTRTTMDYICVVGGNVEPLAEAARFFRTRRLNLSKLDLNGQFRFLMEALCCPIEELVLEDCWITDRDLVGSHECLGPCLRNSLVRVSFLRNRHIADCGVLVGWLDACRKIQILSLPEESISEAGVGALMTTSVFMHPSLKKMDLGSFARRVPLLGRVDEFLSSQKRRCVLGLFAFFERSVPRVSDTSSASRLFHEVNRLVWMCLFNKE